MTREDRRSRRWQSGLLSPVATTPAGLGATSQTSGTFHATGASSTRSSGPRCELRALTQRLIGCLSMVVALLAATNAEAQRAVSVDLPPQLQLGAWRLEPSFAMHTGRNTNINKEANGISDFETALIPHLDVTLETQRGILKSFAAVEFARFAQHGIENGHSTT